MSVERVVAVFGESQGTGVLLDAFTILTCAHVIGKEGRPAVAHPRLADRVPADVRWSDDRLDLALLISERPCLQRQPAAALPEIRLGEVATAGPLPHCEIVGFPRIQRYGDDGALDLDQYPATVLPTAGSVRGALVCTLDQPAAAERHDGTSPLRGLSGAPVFAGEVLLGIVTEVPRGRGHLRLEGAPVPETAIRRFTRLSARFERVTDRHPQDHLFEERYARALKARYQKTRIFGIDELSTGEATWDLDTAYLSLEADQQNREARGPFDAHAHSSQPRRIHDLLADRPRAVLRGEAGAGKTTLVWWLASHAVCGTLSPELAELNGLVPFVVPLRTVQARGSGLPTPGRLPAVAGLLTDDAPPGWAVRVLESGRALLLVDGVDEVPASERDNTRTWLTELLNLYPRTRCLATVRPLAVETDWLRSERFEDLTLLPMRDEDIQKFVTAWHTAARIECDAYTDRERAASEQAHLEHLEGELRAQFERNTALRTLARTPLLCAVICALHRRRGGLLPDTRWDLYRATLAMLLGSRDAQRNIGVPEGITMGFDEHQELLQAIAVWLVRGGQSQLSHEDAERQIEGAMRRLPHVKAQGPASAVLTYLLNRSGLLQERVGDVVQFIHRTFQDYLAARALVEGGSLPELLRNAHNEQWHDTILLAVGHCRPNEVKTLIEGLIEAGDATGDPTVRESVHVLAARCFLDAVVVDETVGERIAARVRALLPPRPESDLEVLGSLAAYLLPLLPDPGTLTEEESERTVRLISLIGGSEAVPAAARYARHGGRAARAHLCANWHRFPAEEYAREVLSAMPLAAEALFASRPEHLRELSTLPPIGFLGVLSDVTSEDLLRCLRDVRCGQLHLSGNDALRDVSFLPELTGLTSFSLTECPRVSDLSALARSSAEYLILDEGSFGQADLTPVREMPKLRALLLMYEGRSQAPRLPPPHARVLYLTIETARPLDLSAIGDWPSLQGLHIILASAPALDLTPLAGLTDLEVTVSFKGDDLSPDLMGAELLGDRLTVETPETV